MAERAGMPMFEWRSGSIFDLTAQARTGPGGLGIKEITRVQEGRRGAEQSLQYIGVPETGTTISTDGLVSNKPQ